MASPRRRETETETETEKNLAEGRRGRLATTALASRPCSLHWWCSPPCSRSRAVRPDARKPRTAGGPDQPTLAPPTELLVTAATGTSISLSWTASSDGRSVVGYRLYGKDGDDAEPVAKTAETTFTFEDLQCGSAYTLSVEAVGAAGRRSEKVSIMSATTACSDRAPPSTPAGLVQAETSEMSVSLSWTASTDNVGVVSYEVFHGELHVATTAELAYAFAGLSCESSFSVGIAARDASGNRSPVASAFITTSACSGRTAPAPPAKLRQTHQTETSVGLAWSESKFAALYTVYQDGNQAGSTRETAYALSGLACGSSYNAGVEAGDPAGRRSERATVVVTKLPVRSHPRNRDPTTTRRPRPASYRLRARRTRASRWLGLRRATTSE